LDCLLRRRGYFMMRQEHIPQRWNQRYYSDNEREKGEHIAS
jgi:hypothetical protein